MDPSIKLSAADLKRLNTQKKRQLNPTAHKHQVAKKGRQSGEQWVESRPGNVQIVHPAINPPGSGKICGRRCTKPGCHLNLASKVTLFQQFRQGDHNEQSTILINCVTVSQPAERTVPQNQSRRGFTYKYSVAVDGIEQEICKVSLLDIFKISEKRLRNVTEKKKLGLLLLKDKRGVHLNRPNRIPQATLNNVRAHIQRFPSYESHYHRQRHPPNTRFLNPELNVQIMYNLFIEHQRLNNGRECEQWKYYDIFNREFPNLKFMNPKTDTCDRCDEFKSALHDATLDETAEILANQSSHHLLAESAYSAYHRDVQVSKTDPNVICLTIDMEQIMFLPGLRNSESFYLRKFSNFNLGISRTNDSSNSMHIWTELVASRGSNEICSGIWKYVRSNYQPTNAQRSLVMWFDRCIGQNNNKMIVFLMMKLVNEQYFSSAEQKFFVTGHSYNICDAAFGTIERKLRKSTLLVPSDIDNLIRDSCEENPYEAIRMELGDFYDFFSNSTKLKFPSQFRITKNLWYKVESINNILVLFSKSGHDPMEPWNIVRIKYNTQLLLNAQIPVVRRNSRIISKKKLEDLEKMLSKLHSEAQAYYSTLIEEQKNLILANPGPNPQGSDEEDDD